MFKFFVLLVLFLSTILSAESEYSPFIEQQIEYIQKMNEDNITKTEIENILDLQKQSYIDAIDEIMGSKNNYIKNIVSYDSEIFTLKKIIRINKNAGNTYAVVRDEVQVRSYRLLNNQNVMIKKMLTSLEHTDRKQFQQELSDYVSQNQLQNEKILSAKYDKIMELTPSSKTLKQAQENIQEFNALIEINQDLINYFYIFEDKMYRLNKYSKYHLITPVLYINSIEAVKLVNPVLESFDLNVVKLFVIFSLIAFVYFIRKVMYVALESTILSIDSLKKYSKKILDTIRRPISIVIIVININMILYVYYDFSSVEKLGRFFNIIYGIFFTLIIYRILNSIAKIKIHEIDSSTSQIKNEIINVGIKVVNFVIIMIGFLVILYFAGVNLTAVLSGLGIGGFAVALAAKDSLANFFGTLSILFSDVFSQGDWIVIDGNEGVVVEIGLRVTTLRTFDNALVAIPNATLANQDVKNWNKRELGRRIKMKLGIKYDSKSDDIKNTIDEIRAMLDKHADIATENTEYQYRTLKSAKLVSKDDLQGIKKTLLVYLDEFSDSSINILVYCFTKSTDWDDWLATKEDVMYRIMGILERNNLEFAFPSISIYKEK